MDETSHGTMAARSFAACLLICLPAAPTSPMIGCPWTLVKDGKKKKKDAWATEEDE
jgi:hypothetical protein